MIGYIYYRLAKKYNQEIALNLIGFTFDSYILGVYLIGGCEYYDNKLPNDFFGYPQKFVFLLTIILNYFILKKYYKGKFVIFSRKWKDENKFLKAIKWLWVLIYIYVLPLIYLFSIGHYYGRTNF